ncbi:MAG TPA: geranylgeranylglyceryl/heptaprenylglyceryl phosphate synthase [Phaeodactylibacter sp.]|nr:geranylgeranylglyceryl/heptaprenylglyceryl phosphate synthase [Phaeodactylibacter sp.]
MTDKGIYKGISEAHRSGKKQIAMLIDPDGLSPSALEKQLLLAKEAPVDFLFLGGSLIWDDTLNASADLIQQMCPHIPLLLFPGNPTQLNEKADGVLFLSLISGRNPELLIGQQIIAAPLLKTMDIEVIPTGYMLIKCGSATTVEYISQTMPIPYNKPEVAGCTAFAGELLGLKLIFMDGGSGADKPISAQMIRTVSGTISIPLLVGGGIRTPEQAATAISAGADIIVVGNAFEKDPSLIGELTEAVHGFGVER